MAASIVDDELKCGICLELFQDPRSLPCLHTFCRECIQRSLNENHSLKCPLCRAKHDLSREEGAGLLPVNQYALQELPLKRLQEQENKQTCGFCGEAVPPVAWCDDCGVLICKNCLDLHRKMVYLNSHSIVEREQASVEKLHVVSACLSHPGQVCKYLCSCFEMVCPECLLDKRHEDHSYNVVEEAARSLEERMKELASLVENKKEEFSEYLEKAGKAEAKALEYSELMKTKVNEVFDGIVASVEAQRNEALQSVSQEVKEIWAQKEMVDVSLAQLDSYTRFADHTNKCTTNASYVAMATQGIKLMERLKDTHGDEGTLDQKNMAIGSERIEGPLHVPLDKLFSLSHPSLKFSPTQGSLIQYLSKGTNKISIGVSLVAGDLPVLFPSLSVENCKLDVEAQYRHCEVPTEVSRVDQSSWKISLKIICNENTHSLTIKCSLSGTVPIEIKLKYKA